MALHNVRFPGESDASSFGHPGKYTFCFAEDQPPSGWEPLHVQLGYNAVDQLTTVDRFNDSTSLENAQNRGDG